MADYPPHKVRQAIERQLLAILGAQQPAWRVSRFTYDAMPGADTDQIEALAFAVGLPESALEGRQTGTRAIKTTTQVGIRFTSRLRADNQVGDYDLGLEREQALLYALRTLDEGQVHVESIAREVIGAGTVFLGHVRGFVVHSYPVT